MFVKIHTDDILKAHGKFVGKLDRLERNLMERMSVSNGWSIEVANPHFFLCKRLDALKKMADFAKETRYPYIFVNEEDFIVIGEYL